jgi:two-component system sensor histidine kinase DegS
MTTDSDASRAEVSDLQGELTDTQRALREVSLLIDQSQAELAKLTQRNASISTHVQQVQAKLDETPPQELRMAYEAALDAQQRLFVMRGQLDKLQSDREHLRRYKALLDKMSPASGSVGRSGSGEGRDAVSEIEMVVNAQESERQRLSRQMHDGPAQAMTNFILQTEIAMRLLDADPQKAKDELGSLKGAALGTFEKLRNFIFELRPMMLDDLGLVPTIRKYVDAFREQSGMDVSLNVTGTERRLEPYLEVMIFRAIQELLGNASRHSQAAGVKVQLDMGNETVRVSVDDNGRGFDPEVAGGSTSLGLRLIKERTEMLGGTFDVDTALGKGARIAFSVPMIA